MTCPTCGEPIRPTAKFCPNCGEDLRHRSTAMAERPATSAGDADVTTVIGPAERQRMAAPPPQDAAATMRLPTGQAAEAPAEPVVKPRYRHKWYRPGWMSFAAFVVVTAIAYVVSLAGVLPDRANAYWYTARATGFITYGLLTISVLLGLVLATRWRAFTGPWLIAERLHPQFLLASLMFLSFHVVALILLSFPAAQALIPFISKFNPPAITIGIVAMYIMIILVVSTYLIGRMGYRNWHKLHYTSLIAWFLALGHAARTGNDSGQTWAHAFYAVGAALVVILFLAYLGTKVVAMRRKAATAGAS